MAAAQRATQEAATQEGQLQARSSRPRLFQLDALRGLAAVTVVFYHFRLAFDMSAPSWRIRPVFAGAEAVTLFFVLSGYVLSLPYWKGTALPYRSYLIRRVCRIYLPFAAAALLSIAMGSLFFGRQLPLTPWYYQTWHTAITVKTIAAQMVLWPFADFNTAFWTLRYEMQLSLAMPLLCLLMKRYRASLVTLVAITLVYAYPLTVERMQWHFTWLTLQIGVLFLMGACLAAYEDRVISAWGFLGRWQWLLLLLSAFLFFGYCFDLTTNPLHAFLLRRHYLVVGTGAAGLIACSLHNRVLSRLLEHPIPEYLGKISYSVYLVHIVVLFVTLDLLHGRIPTLAIFLLYLAVTLVLAHFFYEGIERPAMRLGKRLTH